MSLEALICPQCGGTIGFDGKAEFLFCTYCGTKLQTHRSSLGILSATIMASIKEDTSLLAKKEALSYMKDQLQELLDPISGWQAKSNAEYKKRLEAIETRSYHLGPFQSKINCPEYQQAKDDLWEWVDVTKRQYEDEINILKDKIKSLTIELNQIARNT